MSKNQIVKIAAQDLKVGDRVQVSADWDVRTVQRVSVGANRTYITWDMNTVSIGKRYWAEMSSNAQVKRVIA